MKKLICSMMLLGSYQVIESIQRVQPCDYILIDEGRLDRAYLVGVCWMNMAQVIFNVEHLLSVGAKSLTNVDRERLNRYGSLQ